MSKTIMGQSYSKDWLDEKINQGKSDLLTTLQTEIEQFSASESTAENEFERGVSHGVKAHQKYVLAIINKLREEK